ncbi:MAG: hypothetical protein QG602_2183 [Verrucomicrobiota bacterium]|nr:hypothetical protein [Verrucomicrobiota bacterium]
MSDRLKELQRLRAAAQEQVAWLDREIAREQSLPAAARSVVAPQPQTFSGIASSPRESTSPLDADKLIQRYQRTGGSIKDEVKRGCFIYFYAALGLLVAGVIVAYLIWKK